MLNFLGEYLRNILVGGQNEWKRIWRSSRRKK
jgi:hypothetical protein